MVAKYLLEDLYYKNNVVLWYDEFNNVFYNVLTGVAIKCSEFPITFLDVLKANNLDILLTDIDGNQYKELNIEQINDFIKIMDRKKSLTQVNNGKNQIISNRTVNIISDLLGLNISNSILYFKLSEILGITEVVVSANKLAKFKRKLFEYIKASLLSDADIELIYEFEKKDYRIVNSLKAAKIIQTPQMKENNFIVSVSKSGKIKINNFEITSFFKQSEAGFQKKLKSN